MQKGAKVWSHIARPKTSARTLHTQSQTLSARTFARTSHVRKCDFTHMCAATQHLYLLQILSKLCFQRVALSGNYEIVAISTDKTTIFNDLDYKADIGQHFHKSEKSARWRHRHKIIKTNLKTHISPLLTRPQGSQGCQKIRFFFHKWNCFPFALRLPSKCRNCKKLSKLKKNHQKTLFSWTFSNILQFGGNISAPNLKECV